MNFLSIRITKIYRDEAKSLHPKNVYVNQKKKKNRKEFYYRTFTFTVINKIRPCSEKIIDRKNHVYSGIPRVQERKYFTGALPVIRYQFCLVYSRTKLRVKHV